jgi:four helix bundle protein
MGERARRNGANLCRVRPYRAGMPHNPARLRVLDRAFALTVAVHQLADDLQESIARTSPGMRAQMLRAADSIAFNITEAAAHDSPRQTLAQLRTAIGSANELELQLRLAAALRAVPASVAQLIDEVVEIRKMCYGLRKHLMNKHPHPPPRP